VTAALDGPAPCIIAEIGSTHDGSMGNAIKLAQACARAGADVVKFQDHLGDAASLRAPSPSGHESRAAYLGRLNHAFDGLDTGGNQGWTTISKAVRDAGALYAVSPFSVLAAERQEALCRPDIWKIASGQVTNIPLLEFIRDTTRPAIISAGLATDEELIAARSILPSAKILCCTTAYPCAPDYARFPEWPHFDGLSDHTEGSWAAVAAVALGLHILEKHVTFHRGMYGSDARDAMPIDDFPAFVLAVRNMWSARNPRPIASRAAWRNAMRERYMYGRVVTP
jgi:N-acetylneuraminate synthase